MDFLNSNLVIIILCGIIILSYFFSLLSLKTKIPSVLLLLMTGILFKQIVTNLGFEFELPKSVIELLGTVGLIMIILEAGLDLKYSKNSVSLIKNSFFSALFVLFLSTLSVALIIRFWLHQPMLNSIVYALPLSVISGAIVIPSISHLTTQKRDFLVYEASFSDIMGILIFNFIVAESALSFISVGFFAFNLVLAVIIALIVSFALLYLLTHTKVNVKYFLIFSILILLYTLGKYINLPSLIIILVFGLVITNWERIKNNKLTKLFPHDQIENTHKLLHSITAESSFLIRTFFFILFGFTINLALLGSKEVILVGSAIVIAMLSVRYLYLKIFVKTNIFPELFFMPRGLITILLFYKIPSSLQLSTFNEGILFFVVLTTSAIMMMGSVLYKTEEGKTIPDEVLEQG